MNKFKNSLFYIIITAFCINCSSCKDDIDNYTVAYEVTFEGTWTEQTHPDSYPSNAFFSSFAGMSHSNLVTLYDIGSIGSPGLRYLSETGSTPTIENEINAVRNSALALTYIEGEKFDSPGSSRVEFGIEATHPLVSIVSKIAPSPDWFVGIRNVSLIDSDFVWIEELTVEALAYDSGADNGASFNSDANPSEPLAPITKIDDGPLADENGVVQSLGYFTFKRTK